MPKQLPSTLAPLQRSAAQRNLGPANWVAQAHLIPPKVINMAVKAVNCFQLKAVDNSGHGEL